MQNIIVWIKNQRGYHFRYVNNLDKADNYLRLQVENSLLLGWPKEDIILLTNFPFEYMGVNAYVTDNPICQWSAFANRMVIINEAIKKGIINDNFWVHDADSYQLVPFSFPEECKDVGFTKHAAGRTKPQGASAFYRKTAYDLIAAMALGNRIFKVKKEESFFPGYFQAASAEKSQRKYRKKLEMIKSLKDGRDYSGKIKTLTRQCDFLNKYFGRFGNRFTWLNWTYNLSQSRMFSKKYPRSTKPIKVVHFKAEYKSTMDCFYYGKICGLGKGKIAPLFTKKGNPKRFLEKKISWYDLIPDFLVGIIPSIGGIILLINDFSYIVLGLIILLVIIFFGGAGFIRGSFACRYCKQKELGCPAQKIFTKEN